MRLRTIDVTFVIYNNNLSLIRSQTDSSWYSTNCAM